MTDKKDEALKLALQALEYISSHYMSLPKIGCMALAVVEEALAEPAQQQEPVAWRVQRNDGEYELYFHKPNAERAAECYTKRPPVEPLYTSPPASKPWVGLTDEEVDYIMARNDPHCDEINFARAIEAKLREKNAPQQSKEDA